MAKDSFEHNDFSGFPEMSEAEKLSVRKTFFTTINAAVERKNSRPRHQHEKVHLNSFIGNQEFVLITIGSYTDDQGPNGIITILRTTGSRSGDLTAYKPDTTTGHIVRRELSRENRQKLTEMLFDALKDRPEHESFDPIFDRPVGDIIDDYNDGPTMPDSEVDQLPLVWPTEMQWLSEVVSNAFLIR